MTAPANNGLGRNGQGDLATSVEATVREALAVIRPGAAALGGDEDLAQAADLEQLLGRTHRDGQKADEVNVEMLFGCWEHFDAWQKARAQAAATLDTYGADQKLLIATVDMPGEFDVDARPGDRWRKKVAAEKLDIWA